MRVPSGAYRPPTQSREIERNRQKIDVLSRRQQRMPKIPPVVATAGGGVLGYAEVETNGMVYASGGGSYDEYLTSYGAPWDYGVGSMRAGDFCSVVNFGGTNNAVQLTAGTYNVLCRVDFGWDATPTAFPAYVQCATYNRGTSSAAFFGGWDTSVPVIRDTARGRNGISTILNHGLLIITDVVDKIALDISTSGLTGGPANGTPVVGFNGSAGIHWSIAKLA